LHLKRCLDATDSQTEQGLEVDGLLGTGATGFFWKRKRPRTKGPRWKNGKKATVAVTRCGCMRGECYEGCESRCGKHAHGQDRLRIPGQGCTKRREPHGRQRDATSPRLPSGESRRGGAKPQGRNRSPRLASRTRSKVETLRWSGRSRACRWRGVRTGLRTTLRCRGARTNPRRGGRNASDPGVVEF